MFHCWKNRIQFYFQKIRQTSRWLGVSTLGQALFVYTHPMPPFWCATAAKRCARRQTCSTFTWKRRSKFIHIVNIHANHLMRCKFSHLIYLVHVTWKLWCKQCLYVHCTCSHVECWRATFSGIPSRVMLYVCRCEVSPFCHAVSHMLSFWFFIRLIFLSSCRSHTT